MLRLAGFVDVFKRVHAVKAYDGLTHELFSSDKTVTMWHSRDENWHLLGSNSFFIQAPVAEPTHEIRHSDCDDDWNEDVDVLGSLHDYNHQ